MPQKTTFLTIFRDVLGKQYDDLFQEFAKKESCSPKYVFRREKTADATNAAKEIVKKVKIVSK